MLSVWVIWEAPRRACAREVCGRLIWELFKDDFGVY